MYDVVIEVDNSRTVQVLDIDLMAHIGYSTNAEIDAITKEDEYNG